MASRSQSVDSSFSEILQGIISIYMKQNGIPKDHPKVCEIKSLISNILQVEDGTFVNKGDTVKHLCGIDFLSNLSEECLRDLFPVLLCWCHDILLEFLDELTQDSREVRFTAILNSTSCLLAFIGIINFAKTSCIQSSIENIKNLSEVGLQAIYDCYRQCICSDSFCKIAQQDISMKNMADTFYQECKNLQKLMLALLEQFNFPSTEEDELQIISWCHHLKEVIIIIDSSNQKEPFDLPFLKTFAVLVKKYSQIIKDRFDVYYIVFYLSKWISNKLTSFVEEGTPEHLKLCNFKLKILILICEMQCCLDKNIGELVDFLTLLFDLMPVVRMIESTEQSKRKMVLQIESIRDTDKMVQEYVLIGIEPLLVYLVKEKLFLQYVLSPKENFRAHCFLLLSVLDKISELDSDTLHFFLNYRTSEEKNILDVTFDLLDKTSILATINPCYVSGVMYKGKPLCFNSLYHHACVHVCCFVASAKCKHFNVIEDSLLKAFLSPSLGLKIIATDVWCFLSRYSSSNLCLQHCKILAKLSKELPGDFHIKCLLSRLFVFLTPTHQNEFLDKFTLEKNLDLYAQFKPNDLVKARVTSFYPKSQELFKNEQVMCDNGVSLSYKLKLTTIFLRHIPDIFAKTSFIFFQSACFKYITSEDIAFREWLFSTLSHCLYSLVKQKQCTFDHQFLSSFFSSVNQIKGLYVAQLTMSKENNCKVLFFLTFLKSFMLGSFASSTIKEFLEVFSYVLADQNFMLKTFGFEFLSLFAHFTPHQDILKRILNAELRTFFFNFLKHLTPNEKLNRLEQENLASFIYNNRFKCGICASSVCKTMTREDNLHNHKKIKLDCENSTVGDSINQLEAALYNVQRACLGSQISNIEADKIMSIAQRLLELCS